jgi:tetratricopeptide (TPR) repeat protein
MTILALIQLVACAPTTATLYRGNMDVVALSGEDCSGKIKAGSSIPVELVLKSKQSQTGLSTDGYISGPDIYTGHFTSKDNTKLIVTYPQEVDSVAQGHTLDLTATPDGINGELREKRQGPVTSCIFDKATFKLKQEADGSKAAEAFEHHQKLFKANIHYMRGQELLTVGKPNEAIRELTKCYDLRNEVDRNAPVKAKPAVFIAIAHVMAGRSAEAIEYIRSLFGEKMENGANMLKLRISVSNGLCSFINSDGSPKPRIQFLDAMTREFGTLNGISNILAACYQKLGHNSREQEAPDEAMDYFQKALKLNPDDANTIMGIVGSYTDNHKMSEARKYWQEHAQIVISKEGKEVYDSTLSFLYSSEAQQSEKAGDLALAEEFSREATKLNPTDRSSMKHLARVLRKSGKYDEARELLVARKNACDNELCRQQYLDDLAKHQQIEQMIKLLERANKQ